MKNKAFKFESKFIKKINEAKNTYTFRFEKVEGFNFLPGQYVKIYLDISNPDERGTSRYFTISSSPTDLDFFSITTRIVRSSFKLKLNKLKKGDKVSFFGPIGYFDFDYKDKKPKIFLAGGIGVTPFHSILRHLGNKKINQGITLFAVFPLKENMVFFDELKAIEESNSAVKIIYVLTKEKKSYPYLEIGRIDENMIKKYAQHYKKSKFFIVGPPDLVEALSRLAIAMGVKEKNIFKEDFTGY